MTIPKHSCCGRGFAGRSVTEHQHLPSLHVHRLLRSSLLQGYGSFCVILAPLCADSAFVSPFLFVLLAAIELWMLVYSFMSAMTGLGVEGAWLAISYIYLLHTADRDRGVGEGV